MQLTMKNSVDLVNATLFEDTDVDFKFGYQDQGAEVIEDDGTMSILLQQVVILPVSKRTALVDPVVQLALKDPAVASHMCRSTLPDAFKLYIKARSAPHFFGGVKQEEKEFFRVLGPGSTWVALLEAMYAIFVEAKIYPHMPVLVIGLELEAEGLVRIEWD